MLRNKNYKTGRCWDDFKVGQIFKHGAYKTINDAEHKQFCELTLNYHPLHWDQEFAKLSEFGRIVVVGTYVASIAVGLSVRDISARAIANLDYEKIEHHAPVFVGDTLQAESEILEVRESRSKPDRGIIFVETRVYNQESIKVLSLRRHVLIPRREEN
jgi:acyl dehydratase